MRIAGIQSKARKKKHWGGVGKPHPVFPNILARQFYSQIPLQKVVTDITEFYWHGKKCFFTCYLDLFNNEMLTWNLGFREDLPFKKLLCGQLSSTRIRDRSIALQLLLLC
jgi:transposase InsO family protein